MEGKDNKCETFKLEITKNLIKFPIESDTIIYLLKIFPSKDNQGIICKLEIKKIQTHYYYSKYDLDYFKKMFKKSPELNISNIFNKIKDIVLNHHCKLEKNGLLINITFIKKREETSLKLELKKKLINQEKLNEDLFMHIQNNEIKRKLLKKQISKLEKAIQNKNDIINNIHNEIINLTEIINNLNNNNKVNIDIDNNKITPNDEIQKTYTVTKEENELLKKNLTLNQEKEKEKEKEKKPENDLVGKRYISNNRKRKNKPKKNKNNNKENKKEENNPNVEEGFFCFENDVYKNKKAYESLILFNLIAILVVMYLLCSIYALKSNLTFEKMKDQELLKKVTLLSLLDDTKEEELGGIRENIVDFNLNNDDNENSGSNEENKLSNDDNNDDNNDKTLKIKYVKTKRRDNKDITMLKNEREKKFFKKKIKKKIHFRVKDILFDLKYNSYEEYRYHNYFNNYRDISEIILLFKTKNSNNRIGIFTNNIILYQKNFEFKDSIYGGYAHKNDRFYEIEMKEFISNYGQYIQNIMNYLKNENLRIKKRSNTTASNSIQMLGDIDLFEIYEVKFQK